jgi:hypothetical protein
MRCFASCWIEVIDPGRVVGDVGAQIAEVGAVEELTPERATGPARQPYR